MIVTIFFAAIVIVFFTIKAIEVRDYEDAKIRTYEEPYFYTDEFTFTSNEDLNVAFAFTDYENNPDPIDNLDYGEVTANFVSWGFEEIIGSTPGDGLPLKRCGPTELGLNGYDKSKFYPTHKTSVRDLTFYQ